MDDHQRFLALFLRHQDDIRAFVGSVVRDWTAVDDIMQETAVVLWRKFAEYDPTRSFGAWARGIAGFEIRKHRERSARVPALLSPEAIAAIDAVWDEAVPAGAPRLEALSRCLERVDARSRAILARRVAAGGMALLAADRPPAVFGRVSRLLPSGERSAWNNNSPGVQVRIDGSGPTGLPALRVDLSQRAASWASCLWRPGADWRAEAGISLVLEGSGAGARLQFEIMDNGPDAVAGRRDAYERFIVDFRDDIAGWHERRFPFSAFRRRGDLWPGMPDDGFGRIEVHGFAVIASDPWQGRIERLGLYADD